MVFVAVLSLSTVTVFAGAKLITLGTGKLDTKHGSRQYQRSVKLNEIQKNNAKAGISRTDQGITLRIDNVGLDEGNLLLYYTVSLNKTTTAEKLEKVKKIVYKSAGTLIVYGLDHRFPLMEKQMMK